MKIRGTALAPGVSKNGRLYTPDMIMRAVEQAQPRVAAGRFLLKANHDAADVLGHVGRVTSLRVGQDGSAQFEGEVLTSTAHGKDVAALIRGKRPLIDGVSIEGQWTGKTRRVQVGNTTAETSDGVILDAVAFTANPGVDAARIKLAESVTGKRFIFEAAGPVMPVPEPDVPDTRQLAQLTSEEFHQTAGALLAGTFAAMDARRTRTGRSPLWDQTRRSPFWRGSDRTD